MKHKASFVLSYLCLLALLTIGLGHLLFADKAERLSETENRMLQGFPAFSLGALLDGSFAEDFETYLSDSFFLRDAAAEFSDGVMGLFSVEKAETPMVDLDGVQLAQIDEEDEEDMRKALEAAGLNEADGASRETETGEAPLLENYGGASGASIWLVDASGEKDVRQKYTAEVMANAARVLDLYRAALPEDGTVHFVCAPTSDYATEITHGSYVDWGSDVDEVLQPLVSDGVYIYDATDILRPYLNEVTLYPTIDWHWHPVSASLVAAEMLKNQGVPATDYYEYEYYLSSHRRSYDRTALENMRIPQEEVPVMEPISPVESYIVTNLTERRPGMYMAKDLPGYRQYLGGSYRPWRLFVTGYHTGRSALVIGDSFSNSFIPYLTPYYDRVLSTDLRYGMYSVANSGASIRGYMEYYGVTDVYVVFCTLTSVAGDMLQKNMELFLDLDMDGSGGA